MILFPVVERELREQARLPMTFWLRPIAASVALLAVVLLNPLHLFELHYGGYYFRELHAAIFWTIWICVPLMTADCLSRERREGTLGLLFLTPLKAWEVVVAKVLANGLRALGLSLAVIPLLVITMLLGGVSWQEVLFSILILLESVLLSLGAGLLASTFCRERNMATYVAILVAMVLLGCFSIVALTTVGLLTVSWWDFQRFSENWPAYLFSGFDVLVNTRYLYWREIAVLAARSKVAVYPPVLVLTGFVIALAGLITMWITHRVQRCWQELPPSKTAQRLKRVWCTPAYLVGYYQHWLRRGLERNPVGWLEQRQWFDRAAVWLWLAIAVGMAIGQIFIPRFLSEPASLELLKFCYLTQGVGLALIAAGSFVRERSTGLMELLLVSPLSERQIIVGRLRALWNQVVPAALLMLAIWLCAQNWPRVWMGYPSEGWRWFKADGPSLAYIAGMFLTLPIIGLHYSLRYRTYLTSAAMTMLVGLVAPWVLCQVTDYFLEQFAPMRIRYGYTYSYWIHQNPALDFLLGKGGFPLLWQLVAAGFLWRRLHCRMVQREFSLPG